MEETEQFNIRISKALVFDLEFISQHLKLSRNDWLRVKIAEVITQERQRILDELQNKFVDGFLTKDEFQQLTGTKPTEGMLELKEQRIQQNAKKAQEKFFQEIFIRAEKEGVGYFDRYVTNIIDKVNTQKMKKNSPTTPNKNL